MRPQYPLLLAFLLKLCTGATAQTSDSVQAWKVKINIRVKPAVDIDLSTGILFKEVTYYIKDNLVLRREMAKPVKTEDAAFTKINDAINFKVTASYLNSVYLINLDSSLIYTYIKTEQGIGVVRDSIVNHFEETCYKLHGQKEKQLKNININILDHNVSCSVYGVESVHLTGSSDIGQTYQYWISKLELPFVSPLADFYPGRSTSMVAACFPSKDNSENQVCFVIEQFEKVWVNRSYFKLPHLMIYSKSDYSTEAIWPLLFDPF